MKDYPIPMLYKVSALNEDYGLAMWFIVAVPSESAMDEVSTNLEHHFDAEVHYEQLSKTAMFEIPMDVYDMLEGAN